MGQGQSRLKYQQAVQILLDHQTLSPNDISFWSQFWTIPTSTDEVFAGLTPADIRNLKQQNPANLAILLHKAIGQLTGWIQRTTTAKSATDTIAALNCIRLVTRILPFLFEDQSDSFVDNVFWHNLVPVLVAAGTATPALTAVPPSYTATTSSAYPTTPSSSSSPSSLTSSPSLLPLGPDSPLMKRTLSARMSFSPKSGRRSVYGLANAINPETTPGDVVIVEPAVVLAAVEEARAEGIPDRTTGDDSNPFEPLPPIEAVHEFLPHLHLEGHPEEHQPLANEGSSGSNDAGASSSQPSIPEPTPIPSDPNPEESVEEKGKGKGKEPEVQPSEAARERENSEHDHSVHESSGATGSANASAGASGLTEPPTPVTVTADIADNTSTASTSSITTGTDDTNAAALAQPVVATDATTTTATTTTTTAPSVPPPPPVVEWRESSLGGGDHPLAVRLLDALLQLLFLPHFSLSPSPPPLQQIQALQQSDEVAQPHEQLPFYYIWAVGLGTDFVVPTPNTSTGGTTIWANRMETLKCLLTCFSETLYTPPELAIHARNRWMEHVACKNAYFTKSLFCSLVNIVCTYDPVGWGIPYNHIMFRDDQESVASVALQVLNVLLQYNQQQFHAHQQLIDTQRRSSFQQLHVQLQPPQHVEPTSPLSSFPSEQQQQQQQPSYISPEPASTSQVSSRALLRARQSLPPLPLNQPHPNVFLAILSETRRNKDFQLIIDAFERLMANPLVATTTRLPYSLKQLEWPHHILMFFWHMLEDNKKFLQYLINSEKCPSLLVPMLCFMYENRKEVTSLGVIQLCTFILLLLSGERDFAVSLNKPLPSTARLPSDLPKPQSSSTPYNHFDLLVAVAHRMLIDTPFPAPPHHAPVLECMLTVLANVSPFARSTAMYPAVCLVKLFTHLSEPRVLFSAENVCRLVHLLLETFNNIIQYQFEGNACLIYSILRYQNEFSKLAHLKIVVPDNMGRPSSYSFSQPSPDHSQPGTPRVPLTRSGTLPPSTPPTLVLPSTPGSSGTPSSEPSPRGGSVNYMQPSLSQPQQPMFPATAGAEAEVTVEQYAPAQEAAAATGAASNPFQPFIPSAEWLESWKKYLPLDNVLRMITITSPKIQALCTGNASDEVLILKKLQTTTLVGLLPTPHPILIRKYQSNEATQTWLLSYLWGSIFLQQSTPPLFFGTKVKLFVIHQDTP